MRTLQNFLSVAVAICFFSFNSCKKGSDPAPTPTPTIKPDTLTAGWSKQILPGESLFEDIFFNSSTNGYLCSGSSVYKSTDGGNNWVKLSFPGTQLLNCYVTPNGKAFFTSFSANNFFMTQDGGANFIQPTFPMGYWPLDVFFIDNTNGFCITIFGGFYNTVDGGLTWQKINATGLGYFSSGYASLSLVNNTTGWITSQVGIFRSNGSLTNWQPSVVNGANSTATFQTVYAVSASIVYATDNMGEIFRSTDGGANFNLIKKLDEPGFTDIQFLTDQIGYASSYRTIYKTTDGGVNWSKVVSLGENRISEIHFTDAAHGWACGTDGVVLTFK